MITQFAHLWIIFIKFNQYIYTYESHGTKFNRLRYLYRNDWSWAANMFAEKTYLYLRPLQLEPYLQCAFL